MMDMEMGAANGGGAASGVADKTARTMQFLGGMAERIQFAAILRRWRLPVLLTAVVGLAGYAAYLHPPLETVAQGEVALRINRFTAAVSPVEDGTVIVIPGIHVLRRYSLRDQIYHPPGADEAKGAAPFQSVEGLSLGVDVSIRYALDPKHLSVLAARMPGNIDQEIVAPKAQGILYKTFARYTVREIFSSKRAEIQQAIEAELKPALEKDGIQLQSVLMGKVDLPADYRAGMEKLLAEELAAEKMRFTLELKEKMVKQTALEADAEKTRREKAAEAAGEEQIIAAKAQAEAMKHVLPFKEKQIQQRSLEAEAEKLTRIKQAEAASQARQIEAQGEAESRRKLADAEAYRQDKLGKLASEQMARDGALIQKNPLLIQKALADKLSDKISVIIAPPPTDGGFIGNALLGKLPAAAAAPAAPADNGAASATPVMPVEAAASNETGE